MPTLYLTLSNKLLWPSEMTRQLEVRLDIRTRDRRTLERELSKAAKRIALAWQRMDPLDMGGPLLPSGAVATAMRRPWPLQPRRPKRSTLPVKRSGPAEERPEV